MLPKKLKKNSHMRVVDPAASGMLISDKKCQLAKVNLEALGLQISFGRNIEKKEFFGRASYQDRLDDLHEAFNDKEVDAIIALADGKGANQLLKHLDYNLISKNPKIFLGFSDCTVLHNALYKKSGLITYSGPFFSSFGEDLPLDYMTHSFKDAVFQEGIYSIVHAKSLYGAPWILNEGRAEGISLGGNLSSFSTLLGTDYMPSLREAILFIEDSFLPRDLFERSFESLLQQIEFKYVQAILLGRFQKNDETTYDLLKTLVSSKKELQNMPIVANLDFGSFPFFTFPIGSACTLHAVREKPRLTFYSH